MPLWIPIAALTIFPLSYLAAINPVAFSWSFRHGSQSMPPEILQRVQSINYYIEPIRNVLTVGLLSALIAHQCIPLATIGLHLNGWLLNTVIGTFAGLMRVALQGMVWKFLPSLNKNRLRPELRDGPAQFWILAFLIG